MQLAICVILIELYRIFSSKVLYIKRNNIVFVEKHNEIFFFPENLIENVTSFLIILILRLQYCVIAFEAITEIYL